MTTHDNLQRSQPACGSPFVIDSCPIQAQVGSAALMSLHVVQPQVSHCPGYNSYLHGMRFEMHSYGVKYNLVRRYMGPYIE